MEWVCFRVQKNGKRPVIKDFLKGEPPELVQAWVNEGGNWGVCTGEINGIIVVDCDNHKPNQTTGLENLLAYVERNKLDLPDTYEVSTASGGLHKYYILPAKYKGKRFHQQIKELPSVDFQTNGRYVVGANSLVDGNAYEVVDPNQSMAVAPEWLCDLYEREAFTHDPKKRRPNKTAQTLDFMVQGISEGGRNIWLAQLTGKLLATGADVTTVIKMVTVANEHFVTPPLPKDEVKTILKSMITKDKRG